MLWSSNAALANNEPKWRILPKVNNKPSVTLVSSGANTSSTVVPLTSNGGVSTGWYVYGAQVPQNATVTVAGLNITLSAALTGSITTGTVFSFSQLPTDTNLFQNTTPSAFKGANNLVVGTYGVTPLMANVAQAAGKKGTVPGWYLVKSGMGPAGNLAITANGLSYSNLDILIVSSSLAGTINATATISTNATGGIVGVSGLSNNGGLFVNTSTTTLAITNSTGGTANGTGATLTYILTGRAGRLRKECLVAVPSMNDPGTTNNAMFPNH